MYLIGVIILLLFLCMYFVGKLIEERKQRMRDRIYMYKLLEDRGINVNF